VVARLVFPADTVSAFARSETKCAARLGRRRAPPNYKTADYRRGAGRARVADNCGGQRATDRFLPASRFSCYSYSFGDRMDTDGRNGEQLNNAPCDVDHAKHSATHRHPGKQETDRKDNSRATIKHSTMTADRRRSGRGTAPGPASDE
jgi:hypothetical protein